MNSCCKTCLARAYLYAILIFTSGCLSNIEPTPQLTVPATTLPIILPNPTVSSTPSFTKVPTDTQTPTMTNTPSQSPIQPTSTPTPTIIWTPLPTLSLREALDKVRNLLQDNANCDLPCWWGIMPGETTWEQARHQLAQFATTIRQGGTRRVVKDGIVSVLTNYSVYYKYPNVNSEGITGYSLKDAIISYVEVSPIGTEISYKLPLLLSKYGKPDQVYISTFSGSLENYRPFDLVLYYSQGILALYEVRGTQVGNQIMGCPQQAGPKLWLWNPKEELTIDKIQPLGPDPISLLQPLDDVTDKNIEYFTQIFSKGDNTICLYTPLEIWP